MVMKSLAVPPKIVFLREEKKRNHTVCVLLKQQLFFAVFLKVLITYSRHMCEVDSVGS